MGCIVSSGLADDAIAFREVHDASRLVKMAPSIDAVAILTHSGPGVGGGHVSRCRSLSLELEGIGVPVRWIVDEATPREAIPGDSVRRVASLRSVSPEILGRTPLLVVDSYLPTFDDLSRLATIAPVCIVDDFRREPVERLATILVNYNFGAVEIGYEPLPKISLLGPQFALIRPEIRDSKPHDGGYVFLAVGGADVRGVTPAIIDMWNDGLPPLVAVLGPLCAGSVADSASRSADRKENVSVLRNPQEFAEVMSGASIVLCTSSVTCYEALAIGKPVVVFQVAENQIRIGDVIGKKRYGINLGSWGSFVPSDVLHALTHPILPPADCVNLRGARRAADTLYKWLKR
jgi:spore coat polysaccharide biosynthesis predicted glycosyltransferase SpsG